MGTMTRRKALQIFTGATVLAAPSMGVMAQALGENTKSVATTGPATPIPPALFGASAGANLAPVIHDKAFMSCLDQLAPSIFRYPGGNGANWFDISTGMYVRDPRVPRAKNTSNFDRPFDFPVLKRILEEANAEPSIVLNLLTGTMDTQIEALKHARSIGIPITRIELGNEYYLQGARAGTDAYTRVFPAAADYARTALQYAKALRKEFPACQIGVPILARAAHGPRETSWNDELLQHIDSSIDALIAHIYRRVPVEKSVAESSPQPLREHSLSVFAAAFQPTPFEVVHHALNYGSRKIWVTETNVSDPSQAAKQTWAHALALALDLMDMLRLPRVEQVLCWSILGSREFCLVTPPEPRQADTRPRNEAGDTTAIHPSRLTANGYACRMLFKAARGKTTASQLHFAPNTIQDSPTGEKLPSLYGWKYGSDSALVVNLSHQQHTIAIASAGLAESGYYQLAADVANPIEEQSSFASRHGKTSDQLVLPPYSMTAIGVHDLVGE